MKYFERKSIRCHGVSGSFSERRKRNPELAEKAITESKAFTEKEPWTRDDRFDREFNNDLLRQLDGANDYALRTGRSDTLAENASRATFELSARQRFCANRGAGCFFVLLILGVLGLYTEFTHRE